MVLHQTVKQSLSMLQLATANIILVILQLSLILTYQVEKANMMNYELLKPVFVKYDISNV